jgi:hypothetical protein
VDRTHGAKTKPVQTKASKGLDPSWNETHEIDPWNVGEALEFAIFDKGYMGSKSEGKIVTLASERFYPDGYNGDLLIEGLQHATLSVRVIPLGVVSNEVFAPAMHVNDVIKADGPPKRLRVSIIQATGLKHLNHMTGDQLYCQAMVKHADKRAKAKTLQTKIVNHSLEPQWNETFEVDSWQMGNL